MALSPRKIGEGLYQPLADINVTPLVDVMLVLLIIFMVTAPMLATGIKVNLPSAKTAQPLENKEPVVVAVAKDGSLSVGKEAVSRDELAQVVRDNPYSAEANPKTVHAVFQAEDPGPDQVDSVAAAQRQAAVKGSRDTARYVGRTLFLHTPDGFGRSELAVLLARAGGPVSAKAAGTARNWATVTKLLALCNG